MSDNRKQALEAALKKIEKDFGKGSVMKLGEKVTHRFPLFPAVRWRLTWRLG